MNKLLLKSISEKDLQLGLIQAATVLGWTVHAERPAQTSNGWRTPIQGYPGFPDLVLVRDRILFVELKSEAGKLSQSQTDWQERLKAANGDYRLLRPSDIDNFLKELE